MPEVRLIDANALIQNYCCACVNKDSCEEDACPYYELVAEIEAEPTIKAEPIRYGQWIPTEYDSYSDGAPVWDLWECSECGHEHSGEEDTLTAFCPDCGAHMNVVYTDVDRKDGAQNARTD